MVTPTGKVAATSQVTVASPLAGDADVGDKFRRYRLPTLQLMEP